MRTANPPLIIPAANTGFCLRLPYSFRTLVDLFAGGCDVCSNIRADRVRANDINPYVIGIYQAFQKMEMEELLDYIRRTIEENRLSISSQEAYSRFRKNIMKVRKKIRWTCIFWSATLLITGSGLTAVMGLIPRLDGTGAALILRSGKSSVPLWILGNSPQRIWAAAILCTQTRPA